MNKLKSLAKRPNVYLVNTQKEVFDLIDDGSPKAKEAIRFIKAIDGKKCRNTMGV